MPWISLSPVCRQAIRVQVCALHHGLNILVTSLLGVWKKKGSLSSLSLLYSPETARLLVLGTSFAESQQSPVGLHTWLHLVYPPLSPATNTSILISSRPSCLFFFFFLNQLWMYQAHTWSVLLLMFYIFVWDENIPSWHLIIFLLIVPGSAEAHLLSRLSICISSILYWSWLAFILKALTTHSTCFGP